MEFTGERFMPSQGGEIACEHMNRYYFVLNQLDIRTKTILDIASGEGYGTNMLASQALYAYGVDVSTEAVDHAKTIYKRDNLTFLAGDATAIPLDDKCVNIVVSFETIEHLENHQKMIDEIKRVLKPDGIVIISSPDKRHYSDLNNYDNHFHVKELYSHEFKELIQRNFSNATFFSQKIFVGSIIVVDGENTACKELLQIDKEGNKSPFNPRFNMAVCSNSKKPDLPYSMINYSETDRIIVPQELVHAGYAGQLEVNKSLSYRLGSAIVSPLRKVKKFATLLIGLVY